MPSWLGLSLAFAGGLHGRRARCGTHSARGPSNHPRMAQTRQKLPRPTTRSEVAFVANFSARAKLQGHYVALEFHVRKAPLPVPLPVILRSRPWEKDNKLIEKNPSLMSRRSTGPDYCDWANLTEARRFRRLHLQRRNELPSASRSFAMPATSSSSIFHVRPGHMREWQQVVKHVQGSLEKANVGAHWGSVRGRPMASRAAHSSP